uniref:DUF3778 domain-containing protein n=1 Tax=Oryza glumipatula TaxID=40148 RepID=A0A0E0BI29_9ORYZ
METSSCACVGYSRRVKVVVALELWAALLRCGSDVVHEASGVSALCSGGGLGALCSGIVLCGGAGGYGALGGGALCDSDVVHEASGGSALCSSGGLGALCSGVVLCGGAGGYGALGGGALCGSAHSFHGFAVASDCYFPCFYKSSAILGLLQREVLLHPSDYSCDVGYLFFGILLPFYPCTVRVEQILLLRSNGRIRGTNLLSPVTPTPRSTAQQLASN